jgi:hypothetical protein
MPSSVDITNQKFGRLRAVRLIAKESRSERWLFQCDCGNVVETLKRSVRSGVTRSCGCLRLEAQKRNGKKNATHGHARKGHESSEYWTWAAMRQRCCNPNRKHYANYGGRGIVVCERWANNQGDRAARLAVIPAGESPASRRVQSLL